MPFRKITLDLGSNAATKGFKAAETGAISFFEAATILGLMSSQQTGNKFG